MGFSLFTTVNTIDVDNTAFAVKVKGSFINSRLVDRIIMEACNIVVTLNNFEEGFVVKGLFYRLVSWVANLDFVEEGIGIKIDSGNLEIFTCSFWGLKLVGGLGVGNLEESCVAKASIKVMVKELVVVIIGELIELIMVTIDELVKEFIGGLIKVIIEELITGFVKEFVMASIKEFVKEPDYYSFNLNSNFN